MNGWIDLFCWVFGALAIAYCSAISASEGARCAVGRISSQRYYWSVAGAVAVGMVGAGLWIIAS